MCMASKPRALPLPPPPPPPIEVPVAPMQSPEDESKTKGATTGGLRKAKGRRGLKIDLSSGVGTGLNIPL